MRTTILGVAFAVALSVSGDARTNESADVMLPNPQLVGSKLESVGCAKPDCVTLWQTTPALANPVYPVQLRLDIARVDGAQRCVSGLIAIYDESTPLAVVQAAVDKRYGGWALAGNGSSPSVKVWRVDPDGPNGLGVQLRVSDEGLMLIYLPVGRTCR